MPEGPLAEAEGLEVYEIPEEARVSDLRVTVEVARVVGLSLREQEAQTMVDWTVAVM